MYLSKQRHALDVLDSKHDDCFVSYISLIIHEYVLISLVHCRKSFHKALRLSLHPYTSQV